MDKKYALHLLNQLAKTKGQMRHVEAISVLSNEERSNEFLGERIKQKEETGSIETDGRTTLYGSIHINKKAWDDIHNGILKDKKVLVGGSITTEGGLHIAEPKEEQKNDEERSCGSCKNLYNNEKCNRLICTDHEYWQPKDPDGYFGYASDHVPDVGKKVESPVEWCRVFPTYQELPRERKVNGLFLLKDWVQSELEKLIKE